ncbi:MAG: hypothetical protein Q8K65_06150 [Alphaproteobacteria bacterium]|nr:hypothetical protein [Alphaproteobacteria bacterium]
MTDTPPLHIFQTYTPPSAVAMLRKAMIAAALMVGALAFIFPLLTGSEDMFITLIFLAVAAIDLLIAVFLPALLGRRPTPVRYALYRDRLEVVQGDPAQGGRRMATIPFSAVARLEDAESLPDRDRAAGFGGVRLFLHSDLPELARFPHYDRAAGPVLTLRGLHSDESPLPRIKELVEKSKAA